MEEPSGKYPEIPGLHVTVDEVVYMDEAGTPPDRPHCFVYYITITNDSDRTVTICARKWVVRNSNGETMVIEGDGVVGKQPQLQPGETFNYNSYHLLDTVEARAEGSFFGVDGDGHGFMVKIPPFRMEAPQAWS